MYKAIVTFVLRDIQSTYMQYNYSAEFFNVKPGGTYSNQ
jgi:hypothetical protein